ncbi:hypothetical protein [Moorella sp. E306M]|uniref:hypothetical protein n=1 Tax=Moorella sp. E306M TaxID=2572683 RepID=UPI0010FFBCE0|nr:hypothetical protein [Moorella sp. E306M]GEA17720.1 hypothetical protein E306M_08540 [Moorella sp. E306M]GEA17789.1 hypothetical protein E306M_09230 [Moorella sp. E306M]
MEYIERIVIGVAVRNRLKYWRHQLMIDTQAEFAELLGGKEKSRTIKALQYRFWTFGKCWDFLNY